MTPKQPFKRRFSQARSWLRTGYTEDLPEWFTSRYGSCQRSGNNYIYESRGEFVDDLDYWVAATDRGILVPERRKPT